MFVPACHRSECLLVSDPDDFIVYARLADELIVKANNERLADEARLLALNRTP